MVAGCRVAPGRLQATHRTQGLAGPRQGGRTARACRRRDLAAGAEQCSAAAIGLAGNAVVVTIQVRAVARVPAPQRRGTGGPGLGAIAECPAAARRWRGTRRRQLCWLKTGTRRTASTAPAVAVIAPVLAVVVTTLLVQTTRMRMGHRTHRQQPSRAGKDPSEKQRVRHGYRGPNATGNDSCASSFCW